MLRRAVLLASWARRPFWRAALPCSRPKVLRLFRRSGGLPLRGPLVQLAQLDRSFERGMMDVSATYQSQSDGSVRVSEPGGFDVAKRTNSARCGQGPVHGDANAASLKVLSFFGPFYHQWRRWMLGGGGPDRQLLLISVAHQATHRTARANHRPCQSIGHRHPGADLGDPRAHRYAAMTTTAQALPIAIIGAGLAGLSCIAQSPESRQGTRCMCLTKPGPLWPHEHARRRRPAGPRMQTTARSTSLHAQRRLRTEVARWQQADVKTALWDARPPATAAPGPRPKTPLERFVGAPRMTSPAAWLDCRACSRAGECFQTQCKPRCSGWNGRQTAGPLLGRAWLARPALQRGAAGRASPQAMPLLQPVAGRALR